MRRADCGCCGEFARGTVPGSGLRGRKTTLFSSNGLPSPLWGYFGGLGEREGSTVEWRSLDGPGLV
jgi:hypothetical protein